jgi:hypothetical protein
MKSVLAVAVAVALAGCMPNPATVYQSTSQFPPTPDVQQAWTDCVHQTRNNLYWESVALNVGGVFSVAGAVPSYVASYDRLIRSCMDQHGWTQK